MYVAAQLYQDFFSFLLKKEGCGYVGDTMTTPILHAYI